MISRLCLVAAIALLAMATAHAQETTTLTGLGGRHPPIRIQMVEGAALTSCGTRSNNIYNCVLIDATREAEIKTALISQLTNNGWRALPTGPGAAPGLQIFGPAQSSERCPHTVHIIPNAASRSPTPVPEGKIFYMIGYAPDLQCLSGGAQ